MRKIEIGRVLLTALLLLSCSRGVVPPEAGDLAPDFQEMDLAGRRIYLNSHLGRPVILFFFATWCDSCHREIEDMVEVGRRYGSEVSIICLAIDPENIDKIRRLGAAFSINFPLVMDNEGTIAARYAVQRLPTTFIIGPDGRIRRRFTGWNRTLRNSIDDLLTEMAA